MSLAELFYPMSMTKDEMRDSLAYVETIREKEDDSMDSDESNIDIEALIDDDDMSQFSM